jgi:hypothetical protein
MGERGGYDAFCLTGMNPVDESGGEDGLLTLQLRVARRADELTRTRVGTPGLNLHCWLLAEREILSGMLTDWMADSGAHRETAKTHQYTVG